MKKLKQKNTEKYGYTHEIIHHNKRSLLPSLSSICSKGSQQQKEIAGKVLN